MNIVDLHVHSNKSDGSFTPTALVDYAIKKGLTAFALTDHDTISGLDEAIAYAKDKPITVIPGIEFSTEYEGKDIHIVGLMIDYKNKDFQNQIQAFVNSREIRNEKMCNKLCEAGIDIPYEKLLSTYKDSVITRAHYACYLLDHGYVTSRQEAFERYVGDHAPFFVGREKVTPQDAVALILKFGGIPILAHPLLYHFNDERLQLLITRLKEVGLIGIEAIYSTYSPADERYVKVLAQKNGLLISGGSDFHGIAKPKLDLATGYGKLFIPEEILTNLLNHHQTLNR